MNTINSNSFVTLHYTFLVLDDAQTNPAFIPIMDTFAAGTPSTITINHGQFPPLIEAVLLNKKENDKIDVCIDNAFGFYNNALQQLVSIQLLNEHSADLNFKQGAIVSFNTNQGGMAGTFIRMDEAHNGAWFDFNHPLAGKTIKFKAHIISVM